MGKTNKAIVLLVEIHPQCNHHIKTLSLVKFVVHKEIGPHLGEYNKAPRETVAFIRMITLLWFYPQTQKLEPPETVR